MHRARCAYGAYSTIIVLIFGPALVRTGEPVSSRAKKCYQQQRPKYHVALLGERNSLVIRVFCCQRDTRSDQLKDGDRRIDIGSDLTRRAVRCWQLLALPRERVLGARRFGLHGSDEQQRAPCRRQGYRADKSGIVQTSKRSVHGSVTTSSSRCTKGRNLRKDLGLRKTRADLSRASSSAIGQSAACKGPHRRSLRTPLAHAERPSPVENRVAGVST